jgi:hypothetical protein
MTEQWKWTRKREIAAQLLSESLYAIYEIAEKVGVSVTALNNWRKYPEFQAKVDLLKKEFHERVVSEGIAVLENRIKGYNDRWMKLNKVIEERASDPQMQGVPGGTTGLLAHTVKAVGSGKSATMVDEYEVDAGLLKELRSHEEQAARELGQWTDKAELQGKGGGPITFVIEGLAGAKWLPKQTEQNNG